MTAREAGTEIMMRLPDQDSELVRYITEANIFFYSTRQSKNCVTSGARTLKADSILYTLKKCLSPSPAIK
jgi:hypothetical protein